jgi:hypothetical protein
MASSPIHINEATESGLQQLKGIGPKRAAYIMTYRNSVGPVRNALDLATAAGISLRAARLLSDNIVFDTSRVNHEISLMPALLLALGSLWLIWSGLGQLFTESGLQYVVFDLAMALVLAGALIILIETSLESLSLPLADSKWLAVTGMLFLVTGLGAVLAILLSGVFIDYGPGFSETLGGSLNFLIFGLTIIWMIYGPHLLVRLCMGEAREATLLRLRNLYDRSIFLPVVVSVCLIVFNNHAGYLEEIFAIWCITMLVIKGLEQRAGGSAFDSMLQEDDQDRIRFAIWRSLQR